MRYFLFILLLPLLSFGQRPTTYKIFSDSTRLSTIDGTGNELILQNDTRDSTYGVLTNILAGATQFKKLRLQKVNDSSFRLLLGTQVQGQTITISGTGGGGGANVDTQSIYLTLHANYFDFCITKTTGVQCLPFLYSINYVSINGDSLIVNGVESGRVATKLPSADGNGIHSVTGVNGLTNVNDSTVGINGTLTYPTIVNGYTNKMPFYLFGYPMTIGGQDSSYGYGGLVLVGSNTSVTGNNEYGIQIDGNATSATSPDVVLMLRNGKLAIDSLASDTATCVLFRNPVTGMLSTHVLSGGSGTVTSISQGNGITNSTNPITTTGTISVDTSVIGSKNWVTSKLGEKGAGTVTSVAASDSTGINSSTNPIVSTGTLSLDTTRVVVSKRYLDSKLASVGGTVDSSVYATKAYVNSKDGQWSVSRTADSSNFVFTNGSTVTQIKDEGWILLSTATASNSATIEFSGFSSTYSTYKIVLYDVVPTVAAYFYLRVGTGAGPTWASNANDYSNVIFFVSQNISGYTGYNAGATYGYIAQAQDAADSLNMAGEILIYNPSDATHYTVIQSNITQSGQGYTTYFYKNFSDIYFRRKTPVTGIQLYESTNNIASGTFKLYGRK